MSSQVLDYRQPVAPRRRLRWRDTKRFVIIAAVVIPFEIACARLTYYTVGEIASFLAFVLLAVGNLLALALLFVNRNVATAGLLVIALLIIPYDLYLGVKWARGHRESGRVIQYLEAQKAVTGSYPGDLSGYRTKDPSVSVHYRPDGASYYLYYHIGSTNTAHSYTPDGKWFYYPD